VSSSSAVLECLMFEAAFMRVALLASIAASASLSVLGVYLVIRRVIFLGLVLANAATAGAALAEIMDLAPEPVAVVTAVATAFGLGALRTSRHVPAESIIGWAYATAASLTVLIVAGAARADADTMHLLYGNVLAVSSSHLVVLVALAIAVGLVQILFGSRFLLVTFDPEPAQVAGVRTGLWSLALTLLIGVAAAVSVHEIGALLTFALLTLPPMASLLIGRRIHTVFVVSALIGIGAVWLGLIAAFQLDLPPGPVSVALLALIVPLAAIAGRGRVA
jgi:ABC-type Mn2+/Zn2+ transport system permease subunit